MSAAIWPIRDTGFRKGRFKYRLLFSFPMREILLPQLYRWKHGRNITCFPRQANDDWQWRTQPWAKLYSLPFKDIDFTVELLPSSIYRETEELPWISSGRQIVSSRTRRDHIKTAPMRTVTCLTTSVATSQAGTNRKSDLRIWNFMIVINFN